MATALKSKPKGKSTFYNPERDGVTFSLLSTFLDCREKANLYLQGWTTSGMGLAGVFGSIMHWAFQHVYDDIRVGKLTTVPGPKYLARLLGQAHDLWKKENPFASADTIGHFELTLLLAEAVIPAYFRHWYQDDFKKMKWERLESVFALPWTVESRSGQVYKTVLRGKRDGLFRYADGKHGTAIRLLETKTKSRIEEENLTDILAYERQVNTYLISIKREMKEQPGGVLLNVVRRPALRQKSGETLDAFAHRIVEDVRARPEWYFLRLELHVDKHDMAKAQIEMEDLMTDFLLWWHGEIGHYKNSNHCENKYGTCPYIRVCGRGDYTGLYKREVVFRELEEQ